MKLTVTCRVSSVNASLLPTGEAVTKEITVANPKATVQNLRATVAIQFRLNVMAFNFHFGRHNGTSATDDGASVPSSASPPEPTDSSAAAVDFHNEKRLLTECGLREGDHLTLVPKNYTMAGESAAVADVADPATKRARVEGESPVDAPAALDKRNASASDEKDDDNDEESSDDSDSDADGEADGQSDLFDALCEVVPDLTVLRHEFLANPQGVMTRIERDHPSLFQVIVQNQKTFITLMNDEHLSKAAQGMLHGGFASGDEDEEDGSLEWSMGEEDEEADEETAEQMNALLQSYIAAAAANGDTGDFSAADLAALEESGMRVEDVHDDGDDGGAATRQSDKDFILARVPSEEDEKKILSLTELGFTYEQCKLAFFMCHRSIDRASNMLFEAPPEV